MCLEALVAVATFAVGAAQSVMQYQAQNQDYKNNAKAANNAAMSEMRGNTQRQVQEEEATRQRERKALLEGAQKQAEVQVAGDAAGASGLSLDHILGDVDRRTNENLVNIDKNYQMVTDQLAQSNKDIQTKAEGRINSVRRGSTLGLVAGIGSSALDGYTAYKKMGAASAA